MARHVTPFFKFESFRFLCDRKFAWEHSALQPRYACGSGTTEKKREMTAKQYLLNEGVYCRWRAARSADPFIADELRRLAERFERTAAARPTSGRVAMPDDGPPVELSQS
jgi:hypothetical protein